ncbi:MAG TPA: trypsin-like peptidase domain-containing protein [Burkholderiaceae bacterium]|nr:trypsin-like peptidase domain-containing protein [Burkholderiaceae bacterium]
MGTRLHEADSRVGSVGAPEVAYLSGPLRGRTLPITQSRLHLAGASGQLLSADEARYVPDVVTLERTGADYRLAASPHRALWVNGQSVEVRLLQPGDLIEIEDGPVLRFQLHISEALADESTAAPRAPRAPGVLRRMLRRRPRSTVLAAVVGALALVLGAIAVQSLRTRDLEQQVLREQKHVADLADMLRRFEGQALTRGELREELSKGLVSTDERLRALEAGSAAVSQIIARASGSVALVQGRYGLQDPVTKRPLRYAVTKEGKPIRMPDGRPLMTLAGSGPPVAIRFGGTAFVAGQDGMLITNRHVALPWEDEPAQAAIQDLGLEPVIHRMRGYLPGATEPFDMHLLRASDTHDVAVLRGEGAARSAPPLVLSDHSPSPGDTAILLGYPAGIRALLARAGDAFVKDLSRRADVDDDGVVQELARARLVKPLASSGIVAQVSDEAVVYDAQTTSGGSGGPVLNLRGEVVAVNRATLPEFGGSNIGVPAPHVLELIQKLKLAATDQPRSASR